MTDPIYLDLVSRFAGPASTVKVYCSSEPRLAHRSDVRMLGEAVEETANRFAPVEIVLHPKQLDVLRNQGKLVYLNGPPGTGKSLMLLVKGLQWVQKKKPVQVVSTHSSSQAATHYLHSQLQQTARPAVRHLIHKHLFDSHDAAVETLLRSAQAGELFVIADEIDEHFAALSAELHNRVRDLHLWSASQEHDLRPPSLTEAVLTEPLRTPPPVTRHVREYSLMGQIGLIHDYTTSASPQPSSGPAPQVVLHSGEDHCAGVDPSDCRQCGRQLGKLLQGLRIGGIGRNSNAPDPPRYRDVFILTLEASLHETERDASGQEIRAASGLVQGLRETDIPVTVLQTEDAKGKEDVATMSGQDQVVVADCHNIKGLERKVVVFVKTGSQMDEEDQGRLYIMSRTTSLLVFVRAPE